VLAHAELVPASPSAERRVLFTHTCCVLWAGVCFEVVDYRQPTGGYLAGGLCLWESSGLICWAHDTNFIAAWWLFVCWPVNCAATKVGTFFCTAAGPGMNIVPVRLVCTACYRLCMFDRAYSACALVLFPSAGELLLRLAKYICCLVDTDAHVWGHWHQQEEGCAIVRACVTSVVAGVYTVTVVASPRGGA
jgi:hypothetical protein